MSRPLILLTGIGLVLLATLVLAPLSTVSTCFDAVEPSASRCETAHRSLLGAPANLWVWLVVVAVVVVRTALRLRRPRASIAPNASR